MGSEFQVFLRLGFEHIADIAGYDHILFIIALCAVYRINQWKHLVVLITAFTIGHSITLALATLNVLQVNDTWVEFLIPVTIFLTSLFNIWEKPSSEKRLLYRLKYGLALGFGLIHGLGFSNYLRALLGAEEGITFPLFAFNIGLEVGQLVILALVLGVTFLITTVLKQPHRDWNLILSGATAGISLVMALERLPF